jgi:hypothetical protein
VESVIIAASTPLGDWPLALTAKAALRALSIFPQKQFNSNLFQAFSGYAGSMSPEEIDAILAGIPIAEPKPKPEPIGITMHFDDDPGPSRIGSECACGRDMDIRQGRGIVADFLDHSGQPKEWKGDLGRDIREFTEEG